MITKATLSVSCDGGRGFTKVASFDSGDVTSHDWVGLDTLSLDCQFRMIALNNSGLADTAISELFTISPTRRAAYRRQGWHLFSLSMLTPDPSVEGLFGDDLTSLPEVYRWSREGGYARVDTLTVMQGYWIALLEDGTVDVEGHVDLDTLASPLKQGWNLVPNPYPALYPVSSLNVTHDGDTSSITQAVLDGRVAMPLYGFDPLTKQYMAQELESRLPSFQGFWMYVYEACDSLLFSPYRHPVDDPGLAETIPFTPATADCVSSEGWSGPLVLRSQLGVNRLLTLGLDSNATDGLDPCLDSPAPPDGPDGAMPRMLLIGPEWNGERLLLSREFKSMTSEEDTVRTWTMVVKPGSQEAVDIDLRDLLEAVPDSCRLVAFIGEDAMLPANDPIIRWRSGQSSDTVRIQVTVPPAPKTPTQLPREFYLKSPYPNPFNNQVSLQFSLPSDDEVTIGVFNTLGRLILTRELGSVPAGWHTISLSPNAASGQLYIQIRTSRGIHEVRRIVLLR
jgi:hypothetical protein